MCFNPSITVLGWPLDTARLHFPCADQTSFDVMIMRLSLGNGIADLQVSIFRHCTELNLSRTKARLFFLVDRNNYHAGSR
jgi:hypothetical protein